MVRTAVRGRSGALRGERGSGMEMLREHILAAAELRTALRYRAPAGGQPSLLDRRSPAPSGNTQRASVKIREALTGQPATGKVAGSGETEKSPVRHATGLLGSWI